MKETRSVSALTVASLRRSDPMDCFFCYAEKRETAGWVLAAKYLPKQKGEAGAHFARLQPQCKMGQHGSGGGRESERSA